MSYLTGCLTGSNLTRDDQFLDRFGVDSPRRGVDIFRTIKATRLRITYKMFLLCFFTSLDRYIAIYVYNGITESARECFALFVPRGERLYEGRGNVFRLCREINRGTKLLSPARASDNSRIPFSRANASEAIADNI